MSRRSMVASVVAASLCGLAGLPAAHAAPGSVPKPGANPCKTLTTKMAKKALNTSAVTKDTSGTTGDSKRCTYYHGPTSNYAELGILTTSYSKRSFKKLVRQAGEGRGKKCKQQAKLGSDAYYCPPVHTRHVVSNQYMWVRAKRTAMTIGVSFFDSNYETVMPKSKKHTLALAKAVLKRF
jgi:hypothetical protein